MVWMSSFASTKCNLSESRAHRISYHRVRPPDSSDPNTESDADIPMTTCIPFGWRLHASVMRMVPPFGRHAVLQGQRAAF